MTDLLVFLIGIALAVTFGIVVSDSTFGRSGTGSEVEHVIKIEKQKDPADWWKDEDP